MIIGDSNVVIGWANAVFKGVSDDSIALSKIRSMQQVFYEFWQHQHIVSRAKGAPFFVHIHREGNKAADKLATAGVLQFGKKLGGRWRGGRPAFIRVWFDGGCRDSVSGCGVVVEAARRIGPGGLPDWVLVGGFGTRLRVEGGDSLFSEISGLGLGLAAAAELMSTGRFQVTPKCIVECTSHYAAAFRDIVKAFPRGSALI